VKKHPDGKPRCAKTMNCGNDDDANRNQEFERKWIYVNAPQLKMKVSSR
jgi:hypothetical protein